MWQVHLNSSLSGKRIRLPSAKNKQEANADGNVVPCSILKVGFRRIHKEISYNKVLGSQTAKHQDCFDLFQGTKLGNKGRK